MDAPIRRRCVTPSDGLCTHPGCDRPHRGKGYCSGHLARFMTGRDMDAPWKGQRYQGECEWKNCDRPASHRVRTLGLHLCGAHAQRHRMGRSMDAPIRALRRNAEIGARSVSKDGYVYIKVSHSRTSAKDGWKREHVWVMEQHLGRPLRPEEIVHYKNGQRGDNRLENLELWSSSHPPGQRVEDKVAWAREILEIYGDA